jgi:hypothetical protein
VAPQQRRSHTFGRVFLKPVDLTDITHERDRVERTGGQSPHGARGQRGGARGGGGAERARSAGRGTVHNLKIAAGITTALVLLRTPSYLTLLVNVFTSSNTTP